MGCKMTKLLRPGGARDPKEEYKESLPEPPPPPPLDPRIPLTARQKFSIVKSWKAINRAMEPTGVHMFLKLFEDNRDLLSLFDKFKELKTRDEQAQSIELAEHANIVMNSIDEGIRAMDNADFFFDLLHQIGASHRKIPGFKKEYFWKIEKPFLEAVQMTLDERYSENIEKVYKIAIKFIIETVIVGYDMAEEKREVNDNVAEHNSAASSCPNHSSPSTPGTEAIKSIKCAASANYNNSAGTNAANNGTTSPSSESAKLVTDSNNINQICRKSNS